MSLLTEIDARIEAETSGIDRVGTVLSLAMAMGQSVRADVEVFVCPLAERPGPNQRATGPVLQQVTDTIGVVFAVRARNDKDGAKAASKLELARASVRRALLGWCPASATRHIELAPSDLVKMEPGQVWWLDRYTTEHHEFSQE
jgi:hypothetical protein